MHYEYLMVGHTENSLIFVPNAFGEDECDVCGGKLSEHKRVSAYIIISYICEPFIIFFFSFFVLYVFRVCGV